MPYSVSGSTLSSHCIVLNFHRPHAIPVHSDHPQTFVGRCTEACCGSLAHSFDPSEWFAPLPQFDQWNRHRIAASPGSNRQQFRLCLRRWSQQRATTGAGFQQNATEGLLACGMKQQRRFAEHLVNIGAASKPMNLVSKRRILGELPAAIFVFNRLLLLRITHADQQQMQVRYRPADVSKALIAMSVALRKPIWPILRISRARSHSFNCS